jgi:hypothetical protein
MVIGRVKAGSGKTFEVKWEQTSKSVYVSYAGWTRIGKAESAREAMQIAEAWLYAR